ncbi:hypothetical protein ARAM_002680 [Aspergillus rambellii]|uniref:Response regulatory domain-containing protein n=1 Tax=Aspergillus rambellii TaxID=308745 RepID=A0A0F8UBF9_9EURO|nr:hypothetical protein ARAM_002680 [Aspergillus rambellii]
MHVLIAEDNPINQKLATIVLTRLGCTLAVVDNGQQALDYLAADPVTCPRPDIILMDISMPVMDGFEATRMIRTQPPFTTDPRICMAPIIGMCATNCREARESYLARGMDDILLKPLRRKHLHQLLMWWSQRKVSPRAVGQTLPQIVMAPTWGSHPWSAYRGPRSRIVIDEEGLRMGICKGVRGCEHCVWYTGYGSRWGENNDKVQPYTTPHWLRGQSKKGGSVYNEMEIHRPKP